jgi:O-antigen/teichoic acid export membrane protein
VAYAVGRAGGTLARAWIVRRLPQSDVARMSGVVRGQLWFVLSTGVAVLQGQTDMLVLGFFASFALLGVFGPLLRLAYSTLLVAEALGWALYSTDERGEHDLTGARRWVLANWRVSGPAIGVILAMVFGAAGKPVLDFLLGREIRGLAVPLALFALIIPVRFFSFTQAVDIMRAGRQRDRVPVLVTSMVVLALGAVVGAKTGSLSALAASRLGAESLLALGYFYIAKGIRVRAARAPDPAGISVSA